MELRDLPFVTCGDDAWIPHLGRGLGLFKLDRDKGMMLLTMKIQHFSQDFQAGSKFSKTALHWPLEGCGGGAEGPAICHMWG